MRNPLETIVSVAIIAGKGNKYTVRLCCPSAMMHYLGEGRKSSICCCEVIGSGMDKDAAYELAEQKSDEYAVPMDI